MRLMAPATIALLTTGLLAGAALGQAPPAAPSAAAIARGGQLYDALQCSACHGAAGTGGANNAADLTRSALAQTADDGKALAAFLLVGRPARGMPPARPLSAAEASDLSAKIRSLAAPPAAARGGRAAGAPLPAALAGQTLSILVGDPKYGKAFFNGPVGKCSTCHAVEPGKASPAANLAHIGSKFKTEKELQQNMLLPGRDAYWDPRDDKTVTAIATYANGRQVRGYLTSVSDFKLVIRDEAGKSTVIPLSNGEPKVRLVDRLQAHRDLITVYQDDDMHNLTAYLASLK